MQVYHLNDGRKRHNSALQNRQRFGEFYPLRCGSWVYSTVSALCITPKTAEGRVCPTAINLRNVISS
jgi:hypothetical protein